MTRLAAEILPPSPQTVVIDVGCGTGANIAALADRYALRGNRYLGRSDSVGTCSISPSAVFNRPGPGRSGRSGPAGPLILLMDVLEHVSDDFLFFSRLLAAAAPGCYFLLTVPADESLWSEHDESFGHYRRYDAGRLEKVWAGLPVSPLLLSHFNSRLLPLIRIDSSLESTSPSCGGPGRNRFLDAQPDKQFYS